MEPGCALQYCRGSRACAPMFAGPWMTKRGLSLTDFQDTLAGRCLTAVPQLKPHLKPRFIAHSCAGVQPVPRRPEDGGKGLGCAAAPHPLCGLAGGAPAMKLPSKDFELSLGHGALTTALCLMILTLRTPLRVLPPLPRWWWVQVLLHGPACFPAAWIPWQMSN